MCHVYVRWGVVVMKKVEPKLIELVPAIKDHFPMPPGPVFKVVFQVVHSWTTLTPPRTMTCCRPWTAADYCWSIFICLSTDYRVAYHMAI